MRTEDLFKYGVTPKNEIKVGEEIWAKHGDRLEVQSIGREDLVVNNGKKPIKVLTEEVELWEEPKTLFEDSSIKPTWGNLKKAMEAAGLGDDTLFAIRRSDVFLRGYAVPASFSVAKLREPYDSSAARKHVVVD